MVINIQNVPRVNSIISKNPLEGKIFFPDFFSFQSSLKNHSFVILVVVVVVLIIVGLSTHQNLKTDSSTALHIKNIDCLAGF